MLTGLVATAAAVTGLGAGLPVGHAEVLPGCYGPSQTDLNGDGFDDAVIGNPYATVAGKKEAGSVTILYGDADGRIGEGARRTLTQASMPGSAVEAGDHFGWSVATGQFLDGGCSDLMVGSPGEDWQGHPDAGVVHLITFLPVADGGPGTPTARVVDQGDLGGAVEDGDRFGTTVALGARTGSDVSVIAAAGAPGEDVAVGGRTVPDAGEVDSMGFTDSPGYGPRLDIVEAKPVRQGLGGVPGTPEAGDRFGAALVATTVLSGPLDEATGTGGNVRAFLVGAPGDTVDGRRGAGTLTWVSTDDAPYGEVTSQNSPGVPGTAEAGDGFGSSIAVRASTYANAFDRTIAVGVPGEDLGAATDAGMVEVFDNPSDGLRGRFAVTQDTRDVAGVPEPGDRFGASVAIRNGINPVLVIGIPGEDLGATVDAGYLQPVVIFSTDQHVSVDYLPARSLNGPGIPGSPRAGDRWGAVTAAIDGVREDAVTVTALRRSGGLVTVLAFRGYDEGYAARSWTAGVGGIPATDRFGRSVASSFTASR